MLRKLILPSVLGTAIFVGVCWGWHLFPLMAQGTQEKDPPPVKKTEPTKAERDRSRGIGSELFAQLAPAAARPNREELTPPVDSIFEPIVIHNCRLNLVTKEDVPSQQAGVLLFIGKEMQEGERVPPEDITEVPVIEKREVTVDGKKEVKDVEVIKKFRRLKPGDHVKAGELLARVDDTLARAELGIKLAKLEQAKADKVASEKTRDETFQRWETQKKLFGFGGRGATSAEDVRGAELTYYRYYFEAIGKLSAVTVAEQEKAQAEKSLKIYNVNSSISGEVKAIYKNPGEGVANSGSGKNAEPIVLVQNYDRLQAEGMFEEEYASALEAGMTVEIEPTRRERPYYVFKGHRGEITGVAVSKDDKHPMIVSASEDGTARVWDFTSRQSRRVLQHGMVIRAIACSPRGAAANQCLTGTIDGKAHLWDLDGGADHGPMDLVARHSGAVTCVAFNIDGKICATGGEDGIVNISSTEDGRLLYSLRDGEGPAHRTPLTSINFTPDARLISNSHDRDGTVKVWKLGTEGAEVIDRINRGSSEVPQVGISPEGDMILDEQGREMRVLQLKDHQTEAILRNQSQSTIFRTVALFSPDPKGKLILTTSSVDGVLQLWRWGGTRSYELRQLVPGDRFPATCAAFDPHGKFVVAGTRDRRIYVWPTPSQAEVERTIAARIINVEKVVETSENQVRIIAEFDNKEFPLRVNDAVTIVAYPKKR